MLFASAVKHREQLQYATLQNYVSSARQGVIDEQNVATRPLGPSGCTSVAAGCEVGGKGHVKTSVVGSFKSGLQQLKGKLVQNVGESSSRQQRDELEQRLRAGRRLVDIDEQMVDEFGVAVDGIGEMGSDEVRSASVPSITEGLP